MDAIEKRARELLVTEYKARGELVHAMNIERGGLSVMYAAEIAAVIAALTPPKGYVLVPVEPTQSMLAAGKGCCTCAWDVWETMLAARPEVKP